MSDPAQQKSTREPRIGTDPRLELSPTAQRILQAGLRILEEKGLKALTFENIAAESGENRALIRYHFGSKAGLIEALLDSVVHDENEGLVRDLRTLDTEDERWRVLMGMHKSTTLNLTGYQVFFDLFPHVVRDPELRPRMAELYRWYRELDAWALDPTADAETRARLAVLASLTVAICDGLAMQHVADPERDLDPVFDLYEDIVRDVRARLRRPPE
jgi:AcrR family transcriptional regulator